MSGYTLINIPSNHALAMSWLRDDFGLQNSHLCIRWFYDYEQLLWPEDILNGTAA